MSDYSDLTPDNQYQLLGRDGQNLADVVNENGIRKLYVKSSVTPATVDQLSYQLALNGGSEDMTVNGSVTPVTFSVDAIAGFEQIVTSIVFNAADNGFSMDKFLGENSALTNGIQIDVQSEESEFSMLPIKTTQHFDSRFAFGAGRSWEVVYASGADSLVARFTPPSPFILKPSGTYATDDYLNIVIQDNLTGISELEAIVEIVRVQA